MNIDHLRYFVAVSKSGSITKAAKQHFISPQGMNKAVSAMEAELGAQLLERTHRGVRLTKEGTAFLKFARATLSAYEGLAAEFARDRREVIRAAALTVAATTYALHTVLEDPLGAGDDDVIRIEELSPSAIIEELRIGDGVRVTSDDEGEANDRNGGASSSDAMSPPSRSSKIYVTDLFEGSSIAARALEGNVFTPVFQTTFGVVRHVDYPLDADELVADDLRSINLVCFRDESIDWVLGKTFGKELPSNILLRTSNTEQLIRRVMSKRAVMLLDSFAYHRLLIAGEDRVRDLRFAPVVDMPKVTTGFLRRGDREPTAAEVLLMDEITRSFGQRYSSWVG